MEITRRGLWNKPAHLWLWVDFPPNKANLLARLGRKRATPEVPGEDKNLTLQALLLVHEQHGQAVASEDDLASVQLREALGLGWVCIVFSPPLKESEMTEQRVRESKTKAFPALFAGSISLPNRDTCWQEIQKIHALPSWNINYSPQESRQEVKLILKNLLP